MEHRNRFEILSQILEIANGNEVTQTKIMYKAFLSYLKSKEYLLFLLENDLIEYYGGERTYKTTGKGIHFLQTYNKINEMIIVNKDRR